jgi:hypothetical protein
MVLDTETCSRWIFEPKISVLKENLSRYIHTYITQDAYIYSYTEAVRGRIVLVEVVVKYYDKAEDFVLNPKLRYCTRELRKYLWRKRSGRQVMLCACVTNLFLSEEHWSLVQRYFSHVFVAFRCVAVRAIVIHLFVLSLLTILYLPVLQSVTSKVYIKLDRARRFSVC